MRSSSPLSSSSNRVLLLGLVLVLSLGTWLRQGAYYEDVLPSSRAPAQQQRQQQRQGATRRAQHWEQSARKRRSEKAGDDGASIGIPVYKRPLGALLALPDDDVGGIRGAKPNECWKYANSSDGLLSSPVVPISQTHAEAGGLGEPIKPNPCGRLCGRVGFGQCKDLVCSCPLLFTGNFCLSGMQWETKNWTLSGFKENYFGDFTLNYRTFIGHNSLMVIFAAPTPQNDGNEIIQKRQLSPIPQDFAEVLPDKDIFRPGIVYDSCAVVGSSGILLHYKFGDEINGHDFIMRFGDAVTQNYELHVGNHTTHRITDSKSWGFSESFSEAVLTQIWNNDSLDAVVGFHQRFVKAQLFVIHPQFLSYLVKTLGFFPSLEFQGIMIALHRCASVKLYGLYAGSEHNVSQKYFNSCDQSFSSEKDSKEFQIVKAFSESNMLTFSEPCIISCRSSKYQCSKCLKRTRFQNFPTHVTGSGDDSSSDSNKSDAEACPYSVSEMMLQTLKKKRKLSKWNYILKRSSEHRKAQKKKNLNGAS